MAANGNEEMPVGTHPVPITLPPTALVSVDFHDNSSPAKKARQDAIGPPALSLGQGMNDAMIASMSSVVERAVSQAVSAIDHRIGGDIRALLEHSKRQDVTMNTIKDQVNRQDARITEFADRFQSDQQDVRAHIVELQKQVGTVGELRQQFDNLSKEVQGLSSGQVMHASPQGVQGVSRNRTPKGKNNSAMHRDGNDDGIDFCHLIFGGWNDARRNTIQDEHGKQSGKSGPRWVISSMWSWCIVRGQMFRMCILIPLMMGTSNVHLML